MELQEFGDKLLEAKARILRFEYKESIWKCVVEYPYGSRPVETRYAVVSGGTFANVCAEILERIARNNEARNVP